ncbi:MAG TPA: hypothetical protein VNS33_10060, partial [Bradyrhizobium sp.]|nr:hypothetical protein [Bradyrhizobium sp.]
WTHIAERYSLARTNGGCADGEVVWSWRSNAGAKLVETIPLTTVATKQWSPRRARRTPLKPLRREGRMIWLSLW